MRLPLSAKMYETDILKEANTQISEYLNGDLKEFDLPLNPEGTSFQQTVWSELLNISYGEVKTYGEIAKNIGLVNSARAVGSAINKNPLPIVIPCHRVVGANNTLTGYSGGFDLKKKLLEIEGIKMIDDIRVF